MRTIDAMMSSGLFAWHRYVRGRDEDPGRIAGEIIRTIPESEPREMFALLCTTAAARWCHWGFPLIDVKTHSRAAGFALTDVTEMPRMPWPVFAVRIPGGLLACRGEAMTLLLVSMVPNATGGTVEIFVLPQDDPSGHGEHQVARFHASTAGIVASGDFSRAARLPGLSAEDDDSSPDPEGERCLQMGVRIALNAATMLLESGDDAGKRLHGGAKAEPAREPRLRLYTLGKPIGLNMAHAVRDYVAGTADGLRKLQWTVRGHWRNQAHGPGRTMHKRVWIEPTWAKRKGSGDDAPINLREHKL